MAARNITSQWLPSAAYIPANVVTAAALAAVARGAGTSWEAIGLGSRHIGRGLRTGAVVASAAAATMLAGAALPATRSLFEDERVDVDAGGGELAYQTLLRIPVGTVAFEEFAFRGVLLALLRRRLGVRSAIVVDSALFGLWHILPTLSAAETNDIHGLARASLVAGSVIATGVGGALFCVLRLRSGHLLAPALLHLAFNDTGYALAWWVRS